MIGTRAGLVALIGAVALVQGESAWAQTPLTSGDVLQSVERSLPLIERARRDVQLARGELEEAQGGFDLSLKSSAKAIRGFYDNERVSAAIEQPFSTQGLTAFGGYRAGRGVFAPYDGRAQTLSEGELFAGFELPLLRNRAIDARRADREISNLGTQVAERALDKSRLSYYKEALSVYWDWVVAGQQRQIAQALLGLADARDQQLADGVSLGQIAPVERTDNRRAILQRRSAVVTAERQLQMRAIDLSLYYRSPQGEPARPGSDRLPPLERPPAMPAPIDEDEAVRTALARRPELQALRLKLAQQEVEVRLAQNSVLPAFGLFAEGSRDYGGGAPSRVGSAFETGFTFQLPVQNRKATGKRVQARAKLSGLTHDLRWAEDQVRADVQDALSAIRAASEALTVVTEEVVVARELESLERDRFLLGDSTQFVVNLRELATADAAFREAKGLADYQKALVSLDAATGHLLDLVQRP